MTDEQSIKILIVDDVPDKLVAMQAILDDLGQVVAVSSGREALRRLLQEDFAVVLLDVNMPDIDGFETAALIRERKRNEATPIIFVTADSDETHAGRGYSLGAVDYILAPIMPEVLRAKVGVFVELYRKNEQLKSQMEQRLALAKEQVARAAAEDATQRNALLAEAGNLLARSLDYAATIDCTLGLVTPRFADVAILSMTERPGTPPTIELAWCEPPARTFTRRQLESSDLPSELATIITACRDGSVAKDAGSIALPGTLGVRRVVCLPLVARGRTLGVLTLGTGASLSSDELALVENLAGRAAIAVDNARLYRDIQDGDRRKDEFLAMLGHELRNPMAAIANAIECLEHVDGDIRLRNEAQQVLRRQLQQMTRLVDDLLDVSRITRGKVTLRRSTVVLSTIVARAVDTTASIFVERGHRLHITQPDQPVRLDADPTRLEQILANLLHNAAKYTEAGGQVSLIIEPQDSQVVIRVRDNGIGISPELLPRVFDLFTQADRSLDRSQGGLGIGLTLVRSLVELHGGTVAATSNGINRGSEFAVCLPVLATQPVELEAEQVSLAPEPPTSRRVLVVDDNADLIITMSRLLNATGHETRTAQNGLTAIDIATNWLPDVALIDIGLPGIDGYEVARRIRQSPLLGETLLVAVSGYGQAEDRRRSTEAGFDFHLIKPVDFHELNRILGTRAPANLLSPN